MLRKKQKEFLLAFCTAILIGLFSSGYAKAYEWASRLSLYLLREHPAYLWAVTPFWFLVSWWLVYTFAPKAIGSGIPQVMASLKMLHNNEQQSLISLLSIRIVCIKLASSLCYALGGGAVGREGPTIQVAACIFEVVNAQSKKRWNVYLSRSTVILAGAASGIAAAFNTPLGGIVYAIEELASDAFHNFRSIILVCVMVAGITTQTILGPYLFIGIPSLKILSSNSFLWALLIGSFGGFGGEFFGWCLLQCGILRSKITTQFGLGIWSLGCGFLFVALILFLDPKSIGTGRDILLQVFFEKKEAAELSLVIGRFLGPILSYAAGGAGGIFAPILALGGSAAYWISHWFPDCDVHLLILLGMVSFLTGLTHAPFTSVVLVVEMTDRHCALFPLLIAALLAQWVAKLCSKDSFYEKISTTMMTSPLYREVHIA